jgi:aconitate hydratase
VIEFPVTVRIDTPQEALYYKHGGILQYVLRQLVGKSGQSSAASTQPKE